MDWASGIRIESGRLVGEVVRSTGEVETVPLAELSKRGVPKQSRSARQPAVTTAFAAWKRVDETEYLEAVGLPKVARRRRSQAVFEFDVQGKRFVVPALVLLRGLFRPNRYVLPMMFRPQAIDRICHLTFDKPEPTVKLIADWHTEQRTYNQEILESAFAWMAAYPSARAAASSVHEEALRGRIDMALPIARAKITATGFNARHTVYVVQLTCHEVEPQEPPLPMFRQGLQKVAFRDSRGLPEGATCVKTDLSIPLRRDGAVELTDAEWAVVSPILLARFPAYLSASGQRDLFDGLLEKLRLGVPWRGANYRSGNWSAAYQAHRTWTRQGTFDAAVSKLRSLRLGTQ